MNPLTSSPLAPGPARRSAAPWVLFAVVAAVVLSLGAGGVLLLRSLLLAPTEEDDLPRAHLENTTRIELPPSAADVHSHLEGFMDAIVWARFRMDAADLPAFEASLRCTLEPPSSGPTDRISTRPLKRPWWTPSSTGPHRSCEGPGKNYQQAIRVELDDPARPTVYVIVFEF